MEKVFFPLFFMHHINENIQYSYNIENKVIWTKASGTLKFFDLSIHFEHILSDEKIEKGCLEIINLSTGKLFLFENSTN